MTFTTLCYLIKDNKYLMLHRTKKGHDINAGTYIGVGGHVEEESHQRIALGERYMRRLGLWLAKSQPGDLLHL